MRYNFSYLENIVGGNQGTQKIKTTRAGPTNYHREKLHERMAVGEEKLVNPKFVFGASKKKNSH